MKRVAILGSTGSIGTQALALVRDGRRARFDVVALVAKRNEAALVQQAREFGAQATCLVDGNERPHDLPAAAAWHTGDAGVLAALEQTAPDLVLNGITGAAGLAASEWTLRAGKTLALANKESLVVAGPYLMALAHEHGARILPVDSEHCAIFQCLQHEPARAVRRVLITGSGGPFRTRDLATFGAITPREALAHPTWTMGPRITVGSATMMNKAFEVLEAHWLFDLRPEQIDVVLHPQSIIHSMVEFIDGSILAQLGVPDMRVPILYCLTWPERTAFQFTPFDPVRFRTLNFEPYDPARYPAIPLAYECLARGGDSGAVLNAADEVLTELFLAGRIPFPAIVEVGQRVLRAHPPANLVSLADVARADRAARAAVHTALHQRAGAAP
jgi:1-deoxy-D-xylulose-5-phosphate reductoisomerase